MVDLPDGQFFALVLKLADRHALGACVERRESSSLSQSTLADGQTIPPRHKFGLDIFCRYSKIDI